MELMALLAQLDRAPRPRRRVALALVVAAAIVAPLPAPTAAAGAPRDVPAVEQYTDPFAPLGTGRQAPAWQPFAADFRVSPPDGVLGALRGLRYGPTLGMLLAQVETERARTGDARAARASGDGAASADGVTRDEGKPAEPGLLASAAGSVFDRGGLWAALLVGGLAAVAAVGIAARLSRARP